MNPIQLALLMVIAGGTLSTHQYLIAHLEMELPFPVPCAPRSDHLPPDELAAVLVDNAGQIVELSRQDPHDDDQTVRLLETISRIGAKLGEVEDYLSRGGGEQRLVVLHAKCAPRASIANVSPPSS